MGIILRFEIGVLNLKMSFLSFKMGVLGFKLVDKNFQKILSFKFVCLCKIGLCAIWIAYWLPQCNEIGFKLVTCNSSNSLTVHATSKEAATWTQYSTPEDDHDTVIWWENLKEEEEEDSLL